VTTRIAVEIVFALPEVQRLIELQLPPEATIADAIAGSGLASVFPQHALDALPVGVWGRLTDHDQVLHDGDRVEIYRQLKIDPMQARRLRALAPGPDPS
jgi:putative ubiquitin-RnfH superfamily antitoxin RatB of RatAB toxin-antitoxin module